MKKRLIILVTFLVIVFGGIIGWNTLKGFMMKRFFASYKPAPVTVSSTVAKAVNWEPQIAAVGNFVAINGVDVNAQTSGNVVAIHFQSGQYVEEGQPLIQIDDSIEKATLKFNEAELDIKKLSFNRQQDLYKRGATPVSNVDEAKANLQKAEADVEKIKAEIKMKNLSAPFSGRLGIRQVNLGQFISPGQTAIVSLQSLDPLYLDFNLPEQYFDKLHVGQQIYYTLEQYPHYLFEANITALNSKIDMTTHNIRIQASTANCSLNELNNIQKSTLISKRPQIGDDKLILKCDTAKNTQRHIHDFAFIPGMFSTISIVQKTKKDTIILPSTAISFSLYGDAVYVLEKDKDNAKSPQGKDIYHVKRTFIHTGEQRGNYTVIESGIVDGQEVVSAGEIKLTDGSDVVIDNSVLLKDIKNPDALGQ